MNQSALYTVESQFGPPSELISLSDFLEKCSNSSLQIDEIPYGEGISEERKMEIEQECRMSLTETVSNPLLYAHLIQGHEDNVENILATALPGGKFKKIGKRKRSETGSSSNATLPVEVSNLQKDLNAVPLKSWSYSLGTAAFIRAPRNSDLNVLVRPRPTAAAGQNLVQGAPNPDLVLTVSTYSRLSWGNHLSRSFQHAVLGSQTLGDLYEALPCPSNEIPSEKPPTGESNHMYNETELPPHKGGVICIEGVVYGDGQSEEDYSDKLFEHISEVPPKNRPELRKGSDMHSQRFLDLSLRINEPYWVLHQGSCEHFIVVDQIRLKHPSDPVDGYPFALHIAPPILDLCQACTRVPATLAISGDIRLGQSPCKLCGPCWKQMGEPQSGKDRVVVVPLRRYQIGW